MNIKVIASSAPAHLRRRISLWQRLGLGRQCRDLSRLDAHLLADIGLTEAEARRESRRAIWDAPSHWLN